MEYGGKLNQKNENYDYTNLGQKIYPEKSLPPEWGCLIHPDEIRHVFNIGTNSSFITVAGEQYENHQLKNWIDMTVEAFQQFLHWDIYPRLWRHRPLQLDYQNGNFREIENYAEWEDLYDYIPNESNYFFLKLRHKPIARVHKWQIQSPWTGVELIDLLPLANIRYPLGILRATITAGLNVGSMPIGVYRTFLTPQPRTPAAYLVDYTTGYDHASRVPSELKDIIIKLFNVSVLSAFGEGIVGGLSNYSVNLGVLSESIATTMSAENAFFGARIKQLREEIKEWIKQRKHAYTHVGVGLL